MKGETKTGFLARPKTGLNGFEDAAGSEGFSGSFARTGFAGSDLISFLGDFSTLASWLSSAGSDSFSFLAGTSGVCVAVAVSTLAGASTG